MSQNAELELFRLAVAAVVLGYASIKDLRTRTVKNTVWIILAVIGFALLPLQIVLDHQPLYYLAAVAPILAILSDVYWDSPESSAMSKYVSFAKYAIAVALVVILAFLWGSQSGFRPFLAIPIMMLFIVVLYMTDVIAGGADAKALLSLSILFPVYPLLQGLPFLHGSSSGQLVLPFSFVILVNTAIIIALFVPLMFLTRNLAAREFRFPQGFVGYKMNLEQLKGKRFFWLMESIDNGHHRYFVRPRRNEDLKKEIDLLVKSGYSRCWVTPMIPFFVPMLVSLIFSAIVGNLFFLLTPNL